ncbi:OsmC family protein [Lichenibacterium minor]|uniref:OsmC family protein n=1 Tax=Lichenibacterium minor TaxID=2316528 RepID=UPI0013EDB8A9|nr:OsmC family protein [Lichenibacterium minor]
MTELTGDEPKVDAASLDGTVPDVDRPSSTPENLRRLACRTVATARLRQRHHVRHLEPFGSGTAEPAEEGTLLSEDEEPHPSEMLLAALGACLTVSIQANAVARGIPLRKLEVHTGGDIDSSALWATGPRRPGPLGFESISVDILIDAEITSVKVVENCWVLTAGL